MLHMCVCLMFPSVSYPMANDRPTNLVKSCQKEIHLKGSTWPFVESGKPILKSQNWLLGAECSQSVGQHTLPKAQACVPIHLWTVSHGKSLSNYAARGLAVLALSDWVCSIEWNTVWPSKSHSSSRTQDVFVQWDKDTHGKHMQTLWKSQ